MSTKRRVRSGRACVMETGMLDRRALVVLVALGAAAAGGLATFGLLHDAAPEPHAHTVIVRPTPNVILAIRDLARLESATYHVERVVDLTDKQDRFFGLVEANDAILLVAAADVIAGIDLDELRGNDVFVTPETKTARIVLPAPKILVTRLDQEHTYVHTRTTDLLAKREETLETRARQEAERSLTEAALKEGILDRARAQAARTVSSLVRSLGYEHVEIAWRDGGRVPAASASSP